MRVKPSLAVKNGFTLLEVLIALVLFSFILIMLYGSLYSTGQNWRASEIQTRENDDKRLILSFIRKQIEQTLPIIRVDDEENRVIFRGDDSSLLYVSNLPAHHAGSGIYLLRLGMWRDELALEYLPLSKDNAMFEKDIFIDAEEITLVKNIKTIDLDYYGRDDLDAEPYWRDEWDNKKRLPELIRFRIVTNQRDPWPELVIALRTQALTGQPQLTLQTEKQERHSADTEKQTRTAAPG